MGYGYFEWLMMAHVHLQNRNWIVTGSSPIQFTGLSIPSKFMSWKWVAAAMVKSDAVSLEYHLAPYSIPRPAWMWFKIMYTHVCTCVFYILLTISKMAR